MGFDELNWKYVSSRFTDLNWEKVFGLSLLGRGFVDQFVEDHSSLGDFVMGRSCLMGNALFFSNTENLEWEF